MTVSLEEIGLDPARDSGRSWHPGPEKFDGDVLPDLDDVEAEAHQGKAEAFEQIDAGVEPLSAEDSVTSPEGAV